MMLAILADCYTPLLAIVCLFLLRHKLNLYVGLSFVFAYSYVILFALIEYHFQWWNSAGGNFSSHTAVVMVMIFALLRSNIYQAMLCLNSVFAYAFLMTLLNYHSWFDVLSTMLVCVPCWWIFLPLSKHKYF